MTRSSHRWLACVAVTALAAQVDAQAAPEAPPSEAVSDEPAADPPQQPIYEEEIIADPELADVAPAQPVAVQPPPPVSTGQAHAVVRSRLAADVRRDDPSEEVWEATTIGVLEATVRRSERVRFGLGLRMRHVAAAREHATLDGDAQRFALDVAPLAGYVDATLADGLHLRVGYQLVRLGRFDVLSGTDVLSVVDLRSGPASMPEAADIGQPAARLDWDASSSFAIQLVYLPFFQPHVVSATDTDYALVRPSTSDLAAAVRSAGDLDPFRDEDDYARALREGLSRSGREQLSRGALSAFAPEPSLSSPQGAIRANVHGPTGEVAFTLASALERVPAMHPSAAWLAAEEDPSDANLLALLADPTPLRVKYGRLYVVSADAATEVGPVQLGAELAYQHDRTWFAAQEGRLPLPEKTGVVQAGVRAEYASGDTWLAGVEAFGAYGLKQPSDSAARWMFTDAERILWGAAALVGARLPDLGLQLEVGGGALSGPSWLLLPRAELALGGDFFAEVGAAFVDGRAPGPLGDPHVALGGLYDDVDLVFLGLGWRS